jgi:hypothetical protein
VRVAGHEQLRSVVANETTSRPSASSRPVQLVLDRRLLELIPIDSVTLSNEHGHGERALPPLRASLSVGEGVVSIAQNGAICAA